MSETQKRKHVSYLLQEFRKDKRIKPKGPRGRAVWTLSKVDVID